MPRRTCLTVPSLPAASMPCRTISSERSLLRVEPLLEAGDLLAQAATARARPRPRRRARRCRPRRARRSRSALPARRGSGRSRRAAAPRRPCRAATPCTRRGMPAGIVLAGGRSSRMGTPKAWLDWHGSTLLRRVCGDRRPRHVRARSSSCARPGRSCRRCPAACAWSTTRARVAARCRGSSPGCEAVDADVAFVASVDLPFLHPRFVAAVCAAADRAPTSPCRTLGGYRQPLAAAYRPSLAPLVRGARRRPTG